MSVNKGNKRKHPYAAQFAIPIVSFLLVAFAFTCELTDGFKSEDNKKQSVKEQNKIIAQEAEEAYRNGADYWSSVESNYQPLDSDRVYWVPNGKSYHSTADCVALLKSSDIRHGSLKEAFELGKDDPCSKCVGD